MPDVDSDASLDKAMAFFDRAQEVAATDNFDYAIDMYIEGLRRAPDELEDGHIALRRIALIRQGKGGKKASIADKMKHHGGKTPLEELLNAEYLLAKDPDHLPYAEMILKACVAGGYKRSAQWIAQLIFDANRAGAKPSMATYLLLKDSYTTLEMFSKAVAACQCAIDLKPGNAALYDELRDLSARMTVKKGRYGQEGDFRQSIQDKEEQEKLQSQERLVKTVDFRARAIEGARKTLAKYPNSPTNILKLAEALSDLETEEAHQEAVKILEKAYADHKDFIFKRNQGKLEMKKLRRNLREAKTAATTEPQNQQLKHKAEAVAEQLAKTELEHYRLCVANYPTDMHMKYEYARRLVINKQFDEAIPLFQEAQRDPAYRITAMDKTGMCFFLKGWFDDAVDIFHRALKACEVQDSEIGKDLQYNLARSHEEKGQVDKALEIYRKLAQLDFGYKDIRKRIDKLRKEIG